MESRSRTSTPGSHTAWPPTAATTATKAPPERAQRLLPTHILAHATLPSILADLAPHASTSQLGSVARLATADPGAAADLAP
ncbi:hypothetical protein ACQEU8_00750 [Streptomyces sp. CA-250714]|uniref:hypothetical protein n=1 Tax=Streptomyces sp. CA-250714 TaxID=3240060 RepID=UPI003D901411